MDKKTVFVINCWRDSGETLLADLIADKVASRNGVPTIESCEYAIINDIVTKYFMTFVTPEDFKKFRENPSTDVYEIVPAKLNEVAKSAMKHYNNFSTKDNLEVQNYSLNSIYRKLSVLFNTEVNLGIFGIDMFGHIASHIIDAFYNEGNKYFVERQFDNVILLDNYYTGVCNSIKKMEEKYKDKIRFVNIVLMNKKTIPQWVSDGFNPYDEHDVYHVKLTYDVSPDEYEWCLSNISYDFAISNDGNEEDLKKKVDKMFQVLDDNIDTSKGMLLFD